MYFRSPNKSRWSLENGYDSQDELMTYPYRVTTATKLSSLEITLSSLKSEQDYMCQGSYEGYKVFLHTSDQLMRPFDKIMFVPVGQFVTALVKAHMMETSEQLRNYSPSRRQCYFSDERYLRYFNSYSQNSCELECLSNYTIYNCNCVAFALPSKCNLI